MWCLNLSINLLRYAHSDQRKPLKFSGFFICIKSGFEPVKVAASNKQSGGLFVAGESRAQQARPVSMRSEAEADGESCHPDHDHREIGGLFLRLSQL
jgi:hypothetical protein